MTNFVGRMRQRLRLSRLDRPVGLIAAPRSSQFLLEPLESRVLMSADPIAGAVPILERATIVANEPTVIAVGLLNNSNSLVPAALQDSSQSGSIASEQSQGRHEIVFVDSHVKDYQQLVDSFLSQSNEERRIEVRILDAEHDGIGQISQALAGFTNLDAVHLISHGSDGAMELGSTRLDQDSLQAMADSISGWRASLSEDADLLLYGCDLAASPAGVSFVEQLSLLTGADVAASVNATGSADRGGDWVLERSSGEIETAIPSEFLKNNWSGLLVAPTASNMNTAETYTLNTPLNLANIVITDPDSSNVTARLTLSNPAAGSLSTGTSGAVTSTYNTVTGVWTASGAVADVNKLLANVTYTPSLLYLLPFTIATSVDDGVSPAITGSKSMTAGLLNLPPSATNLNAPQTYTEDTPLDLTNIVVSDLDSPNVTATLTLSNPAAGALSTAASGAAASTYNAATGVWSASGAKADVNALLAGVTFTPAANYNGNFTIATSVDDGVAAPITGAKNITGISVNDAPVLLNNTLSISEGGSVVLSSSQISATDPDNASGNLGLIFSVSSVSGGQFERVVGPGVAITTFTQGQVSSGAVRFVHDGGEVAPSYDVTVSHGSLSDGPHAATIIFAVQNDAPTATNLSAPETYIEDTPLNLTDIVVSDVDSANVTVTLSLSNSGAGSLSTATAGSVTSIYNATTGVWTASGVKADVNALLAGVTFTPAANYNSNFTIATTVDDGIAAPITGVKSMTGIPINDAPTASNMNTPETYTLNTPLNLADIVVNDPDGNNVTVTLTLSDPAAGSLSTATSGLVTSTYNAASGVWTATGAVADVNALLANLTYTPSLFYLSPFTISTSVDDGVAPAISGSKSMTVGLINLPPFATNLNAPETYTEDTPLDLTDIVVSDLDSPNVTVTLTLSDSSAGTLSTGISGSVTSTYNVVTGVWSASGAIADVNALLTSVTFAPTADYNGSFTIATSVDDGVAFAVTGVKTVTGIPVDDAPTATNLSASESYTEDTPLNLTDIVVSDVDSSSVTVTLTLSDPATGNLNTATAGLVSSTYNAATGVWSASGAVGDVNALLAGLTFTPAPNYNGNFTIATSVDDGVAPPLSGVKNVTGTAVNDAPVLVNNTLSIGEGGTVILSASEMSAADVDNAAGALTFTVSNVSGGQFELVGSAGIAITSFTQAQLSGGTVRFVHDGGEAAPTYDVMVSDGSLSDGPATATINFSNQNDAPTATNLSAPESYTEDTSLDLTDIVVSDVDSANVTVTLTLSDAAAGSLNTATSGSVTSTYNAATGVWSASGAVADVNTLLANLTFTPATNYSASFTIATRVDDGVAPPISGVKNVIGIPVNDAPVLVNNTFSIGEGGSVVLSTGEMSATDVDNATGSLIFTVSNVSGGQFELVGSPGIAITSFTQAQLSGGAVRFVHDGGETAPTYDVTVSDGSLSDGPVTATINFSNQNDAPVLLTNALVITQGNSVVFSSANLSASDPDNASSSLAFSVSNVSGGHFELVASPGIVIAGFTQAQLTGGAVRFVQDGSTSAPYYEVTVSDGLASVGPVAATVTFNTGLTVDPFPLPPTPGPVSTPSPVEEPTAGPGEIPGVNPNPAPTEPVAGGGDTASPSSMPSDPFGDGVQSPADGSEHREVVFLSAAPARVIARQANESREVPSLRSDVALLASSSDLEEAAPGSQTGGEAGPLIGASGFVQGLDKLRHEVSEATYVEKLVVGSTLTATASLSIGYVLWLLRGEVLLTSFLASLPAWRLIDPLPVLSFLNKRSEEDEEDDDSLEATVQKGGEMPQPARAPAQPNDRRPVKWRIMAQHADAMTESS